MEESCFARNLGHGRLLYDRVRGNQINTWYEMVCKRICSVDKVGPPSKYGYDKDTERGWKSA